MKQPGGSTWRPSEPQVSTMQTMTSKKGERIDLRYPFDEVVLGKVPA
jgi:hypothetical protein